MLCLLYNVIETAQEHSENAKECLEVSSSHLRFRLDLLHQLLNDFFLHF